MKEEYFDCVEKVSQIIFEAIATKEENLQDKIWEIDTDLLSSRGACHPVSNYRFSG